MSENRSSWAAWEIIGAAGAAALSWAKFHSVAWAIWAALWGWPYIIYYVIRYAGR
jgi:hypothetical protein